MSSNAAVSMPAKRSARSASTVDVAVGRTVRSWRIARGMSQTQLGKRAGVTFQQVQKYESGGNRIPTGRLVEIAAALGIPISALFEGTGRGDRSQSLLALVSDSRSFRLAHAFAAIKHKTARLSLVNLVENIAAAVARPKRRRRRP
jgi:transcriptional regulator with XRE-family HTH domain